MKSKVITIGRQYGSGGREIGEKLGVPFHDKFIHLFCSHKTTSKVPVLGTFLFLFCKKNWHAL